MCHLMNPRLQKQLAEGRSSSDSDVRSALSPTLLVLGSVFSTSCSSPDTIQPPTGSQLSLCSVLVAPQWHLTDLLKCHFFLPQLVLFRMRPGVMNLQQSRTNYISLSLGIWLLQRGPQLQARPCKQPYQHCITPASVGPHPTGLWCCCCEHTHALACTRTQRSDDKAYGGGYSPARLKVPWPRSEVVRICTLVLE